MARGFHQTLFRSLFLMATTSFCCALEATLMLDSLDIKEQVSGLSSEIYFNLVERDAQGELSHKTHPLFPYSYTKANLTHFQPTVFWKDVLKKSDHIELNISMIERELPPWMQDELLATIKVSLKEHEGQLITLWDAQNYGVLENNDATLMKQTILIKHPEIQYRVVMHVESK